MRVTVTFKQRPRTAHALMPPEPNDDSSHRHELIRTLRVLLNEVEHQRTQAHQLLEENRQLREANGRLAHEMNVRARSRRDRSK